MWRVHTVDGYYDKHWLMGLWSTQDKVASIVLKAAWHWGRNSIVVNYPVGEPDSTPLYVGVLSGVGLFGW